MALCQRKPAVFADRFGAVFRQCCQDRGTVHGGRLCWCPQNPAMKCSSKALHNPPAHLSLYGFAAISVVAVPVLRIERFRRFVRRHRDNCGRGPRGISCGLLQSTFDLPANYRQRDVSCDVAKKAWFQNVVLFYIILPFNVLGSGHSSPQFHNEFIWLSP